MANNQLYLWGDNYGGELGDNDATNDKSSPVQTVSGGSDWKSVCGGYGLTLATKTNGTLWSWGFNYVGGLGNGTTTNTQSPAQVGTDTNWSVVFANRSNNEVCGAIKTNGTLWTWGDNAYGQLGDNTSDDKSSPVQIMTGGTWSTAGFSYTSGAGIKTDGTLWTWGADGYGQLGDNDSNNKSSPVQTVCGGNTWHKLSVGYGTVAAIKNNGTLWLWGSNWSGTIGNDATNHISSPVQTICGGTDWAEVSVGGWHTCAIKDNGTLWTWGYNSYGQLGNNDTTNYSSPIQVGTDSTWSKVACGYYFTLAQKTDGTVWSWGSNYNAELGDGTTTLRSSPVQVITTGVNWSSVTAGVYHSMGLVETMVPQEVKSCVKTVCDNKAGFPCHVPTSTNANNCRCATWRMFYPRCSVILQNLGRCSATAGAYVPAITVCNERLF